LFSAEARLTFTAVQPKGDNNHAFNLQAGNGFCHGLWADGSCGATITGAGTGERVAGLVYIAAVAPDVQETVQSELNKYPAEILFQDRGRRRSCRSGF